MKKLTIKALFFLSFLAIILPFNILAQNYTFKVIALSGASTNKAGKNLKIGETLNNSDKITVKPQGYIALAHAKGGTVQISQKGSWTIKELEQGLEKSQKSFGKKYVDFVIGAVVKNGEVNIHKNPHKYQNVTGSVERALKSNLIVNLPKTSSIFKDKYYISWHSIEGVNTYLVKIFDESDKVSQTIEVKDTNFVIDIKSIKREFIKVGVYSKAKAVSLSMHALNNLIDEDLNEFQEKYNKFLKEFEGEEKNAHFKLLEANFFEENNMILDAHYSYQEAQKLAPKEEIYEIALKQFVIRHGIGNIESIISSKSE
jgi:hypothetical protein